MLFILLSNFFIFYTSALQSRHTFPVNSFFLVTSRGKNFFVAIFQWNRYACGWNQFFFSISNWLKYFGCFFIIICSENFVHRKSFKKMSNSCWNNFAIIRNDEFLYIKSYEIIMCHLCVGEFFFYHEAGHRKGGWIGKWIEKK